MSFTHALSTNRYGEGDLIVSTSAANGTHVNLASAMAAAVSGQTIFLRDSVTENVTLTAGVNIAAWVGGSLNTPSIIGTITMTAAGTCNISGIRLQTNGATAAIAVTGTEASILNITNCFLNFSANTGITFSSSSASSRINISNSIGDLGTTGIALFTHTSNGILKFRDCVFTNSGGSSTVSTCSAGTLIATSTSFVFPITTSGTSALTYEYVNSDSSAQNVTALTTGGSGTQLLRFSRFASGSASALSIGGTVAVDLCTVNSTNTNAITGAGTLNYSVITYEGSSNLVNTTTQSGLYTDLGMYKSRSQPAFLAAANAQSNVTGDGTVYTVLFANEIYDQNSNFSSPNFTAPVTGKYHFDTTHALSGLGVANLSVILQFVTSNRNIGSIQLNIGVVRDASGNYATCASTDVDMDAGDTASVSDTVYFGTKIVGILNSAFFSGRLIA